MANLVAESGGNKGQLSHLAEAITRKFRVLEIPLFQQVSSADAISYDLCICLVQREYLVIDKKNKLYKYNVCGLPKKCYICSQLENY